MINKIKQLAQKIGIDGAIGFTVLARFISAGGAFIIITLIALFLSKEEQGYYYTFGSIIAIQVFFELGLNGIITQYVAHEAIHLNWLSDTELSGSKEHLSRLASLLHFCIKVFSLLALSLFVILLIFGFLFFTKYQHEVVAVTWKLPWAIVAFSTSLMLIVNPLLAFLEGLGKVKEVAKIRLIQQCVNIITIALVFLFKGRLFALGIASLVSFFVLAFSIVFTYRKSLLLFIYNAKDEWKVDYLNEIFPFQWKIALSWISGYFIFQLFNPVLFATEGAVVAGQMGMTLAVLNGILSLSMSWMSTKVPLYSNLIALQDYRQLDKLFNTTLKQSSFINALALIAMFLGVYFIRHFHLTIHDMNLGNRFLNYLPMFLMMSSVFLNQFVFSWATYLRCHKKEPYLLMSIIMGVLCMLSTVLFGKYYGVIGITIGYSIITLCSFFWAYLVFLKKRELWHGDTI